MLRNAIFRSKKFDFPPEFTIGASEVLEVKKEHQILGVIVQDDLKWGAQVQQMISRATRTIWVIRRMRALGVQQSTLVEYWRSEGRCHLELAIPVWHSSLTSAQSSSLSRAQRVALAAITGQWAESHTLQLEELGLESLGQRRDRISKKFAQRTATDSRHQDIFTKVESIQRHGKQDKYRIPKTRTTSYHKSAVPYLTRLLNSS
jgi:hypothetical protein